jgi:hypothetical protein
MDKQSQSSCQCHLAGAYFGSEFEGEQLRSWDYPFMWKLPTATVPILLARITLYLFLYHLCMLDKGSLTQLTFSLGIPDRVRPLADPSNLCYYRD